MLKAGWHLDLVLHFVLHLLSSFIPKYSDLMLEHNPNRGPFCPPLASVWVLPGHQEKLVLK